MGDPLRRIVTPSLDEPLTILAFEGWNDAGEAASSAVRYVADATQSVPLAEIDPEEFFDFTVRRPEVRIGKGAVRLIEWPSFELRYASAGPGRELVLGVGPEPHFRWRRYVGHLLRLLQDTGVRRVALLGAFLADVLYSRPARVVGFASEPGLLEKLAVEPSGYEGPTGIVGVLASELAAAGFEVASLWVGLPHYINASPNPRGALALVQKLTEYLDFRVDDAPLAREAADFENRVSEMVAGDPALSEYVKDLKRREFAQ
jgi:proteasome assembly chaperone (PAC2) family protein